MTDAPDETPCDVLILGAGIAGLTSAITLAKRGLRVCVVRPSAAASPYGESLDWEAPALLRDLGVDLDAMVAADEATYKRGAVASHASSPARMAIGAHWIYRALMWCVGRSAPTLHLDRAALDLRLEALASALGARILSAKITRVSRQDDHVTGVTLDDGRTLTARAYIDATGRARLLARALAIESEPFGERKVAWRARAVHVYDHTGTRIRLDDEGDSVRWCWDIHVGQTRTDIGVVALASEVQRHRAAGGDAVALVRHLVTRHHGPYGLDWLPDGWAEQAAAQPCSFQDYVSVRLRGENWWLVGESAAVIDPLLSSGVTFALRSGRAAAHATALTLTRATDAAAYSARVERKLRMHARTVNALLESVWYQGRWRHTLGLQLNVLMILVVNFNLNHLHARRWAQRAFGVALLASAHALIDRALLPALTRLDRALARRLATSPTPATSLEHTS